MGRDADPPVRLRGAEPAQCREPAGARRKPGLAAGEGNVIVGQPTLGQFAEAAFDLRPEETLGGADGGLAR